MIRHAMDGLRKKLSDLRTHKQSVTGAIKPASDEPQDVAEAILSHSVPEAGSLRFSVEAL